MGIWYVWYAYARSEAPPSSHRQRTAYVHLPWGAPEIRRRRSAGNLERTSGNQLPEVRVFWCFLGEKITIFNGKITIFNEKKWREHGGTWWKINGWFFDGKTYEYI